MKQNSFLYGIASLRLGFAFIILHGQSNEEEHFMGAVNSVVYGIASPWGTKDHIGWGRFYIACKSWQISSLLIGQWQQNHIAPISLICSTQLGRSDGLMDKILSLEPEVPGLTPGTDKTFVIHNTFVGFNTRCQRRAIHRAFNLSMGHKGASKKFKWCTLGNIKSKTLDTLDTGQDMKKKKHRKWS